MRRFVDWGSAAAPITPVLRRGGYIEFVDAQGRLALSVAGDWVKPVLSNMTGVAEYKRAGALMRKTYGAAYGRALRKYRNTALWLNGLTCRERQNLDLLLKAERNLLSVPGVGKKTLADIRRINGVY